jgi:hypothetical protein
VTIAFDCAGCGIHVVSAIATHPPETRCAGCAWLAALPDTPERERLRAELAKWRVTGAPRPAVYRCPTCGARELRHCCGHRPYRPGCAWAPPV